MRGAGAGRRCRAGRYRAERRSARRPRRASARPERLSPQGCSIDPNPPPSGRPDGRHPARRHPGAHLGAHDRAAGGRGRVRREAGGVPRTGVHHLLPALAAGRSRARRFFERAMPNPAVQPLFDRARALGVGFSVGYAELTPEGKRFNSAVAGAAGRRHPRPLPQGASAGLDRAAAGRPLPAAREALLRLRRPRLPRLPRRPGLGRRDHRHDDLQRPALAGSLARARAAGRRAGLRRLQLRRLRPQRRRPPRTPRCAPSIPSWWCRPTPT